jgi:hypothetical protein
MNETIFSLTGLSLSVLASPVSSDSYGYGAEKTSLLPFRTAANTDDSAEER